MEVLEDGLASTLTLRNGSGHPPKKLHPFKYSEFLNIRENNHNPGRDGRRLVVMEDRLPPPKKW